MFDLSLKLSAFSRMRIRESQKSKDAMPKSEAFITTIFGIILPTGDVWSDWALIITLFVGRVAWKDETCGGLESYRYIYGGISLSIILMSFLFMTVHWWRIENNIENRLMTLPFLLLQACFPISF